MHTDIYTYSDQKTLLIKE